MYYNVCYVTLCSLCFNVSHAPRITRDRMKIIELSGIISPAVLENKYARL